MSNQEQEEIIARAIQRVRAWPEARKMAMRVGKYACSGCEVRAVNEALKPQYQDPELTGTLCPTCKGGSQ
jgi:hypothetical protein